MYVTPRSKIYFLQTQAGKLLALGLALSSGVAHGLIIDTIFEKTAVMGISTVVLFLLFLPIHRTLSRLRPEMTTRVYWIIGFYIFLIAIDRYTRPVGANTLSFVGVSVLFSAVSLVSILSETEKTSRMVLDQRTFYARASNDYKKQDFASAIANFTGSIDSGNTSRDVYYFRGISYGMIDQYDEALADFRIAMDIDPAFEDVYLWRGLTYYSINPDHPQVRLDWERVVAKCDDEELKRQATAYLQAIQQAADSQ